MAQQRKTIPFRLTPEREARLEAEVKRSGGLRKQRILELALDAYLDRNLSKRSRRRNG